MSTIIATAIVVENPAKKDEFLLVQEKPRKEIPGIGGQYNLPAEQKEPGELIIPCGRRAGEEETGFKIEPTHLIGIYHHPNVGGHDIIIFVLAAKIVGGKLHTPTELPADILSAGWVPWEEIQSLRWQGKLVSHYVALATLSYRRGEVLPLEAIQETIEIH